MKRLLYWIAIVTLAACTTSLPEASTPVNMPANVFPNNDSATLPPNIAPMNIRIDEEGDEYVTHIFSNADKEGIIVGGKETNIDLDTWHALLEKTKGDTLCTQVFVKRNGTWHRYPEMKNYVAEEEVDPYISYRLIQPSYVDYEDIYICQRNMTNFEETVLYDNREFSDGVSNGQCVNCHSYQDYNRKGRMQMHLRQQKGGTLIADAGTVKKVDLKTDQTLSAGVYPAWHPTADLIAYSVNSTGQVFHTCDVQKVEVIDYGSDLILYDMKANTVMDIDCDPDEYETFPAWSADGKTLYYCSAHYHQTTDNIDNELNVLYDSLKYNIYARSFDVNMQKFGDRRLVFDAASLGKSASQPRVSPDGKTLLFTLGDYGQFHIWHSSARICSVSLDVQSDASAVPADVESVHGASQSFRQLNDQHASFHSWSSNGRWIMFASRRVDGNYSRLFIAYFDQEGRMHKPFMLPQEYPSYNDELFRSFNVPEWMVEPVQNPEALKIAARGDALPATYGGSALATPQSKKAAQPTTDGTTNATSMNSRRAVY